MDCARSRDHFGLVFVDGNRPEMYGLRLVLRIRGKQNLSSLPIGVITTQAATGDPEPAITLGARGYLTKPV
jgi:CheY-like chemotaxis protein